MSPPLLGCLSFSDTCHGEFGGFSGLVEVTFWSVSDSRICWLPLGLDRCRGPNLQTSETSMGSVNADNPTWRGPGFGREEVKRRPTSNSFRRNVMTQCHRHCTAVLISAEAHSINSVFFSQKMSCVAGSVGGCLDYFWTLEQPLRELCKGWLIKLVGRQARRWETRGLSTGSDGVAAPSPECHGPKHGWRKDLHKGGVSTNPPMSKGVCMINNGDH